MRGCGIGWHARGCGNKDVSYSVGNEAHKRFASGHHEGQYKGPGPDPY